jgi:CRP-like cAMP-binding protein
MANEGSWELLARAALFRGVSQKTLGFLAQRSRPRRWRRGETLVREGEPAQSLFVISAGTVKVSRLSDEGDEVVLGLIGRGGCIGEVTVLAGESRSATVTAQEPVEALLLAREDLLAAIRTDPEFSLAMMATLAARLRAADMRLEDAYLADLGTRLARLLVRFAEELGHETSTGIEAPIPLTQAEIASMLDAGRPRVNQELGRLQDESLIDYAGRSFTVLDMDGLRRLAGR